MSNDEIGNDMEKLAARTAASQQAINDIVDSVAESLARQAPRPAAGKQTALRLSPHTQARGEIVVEVWHDGEFVAEVVAADGCGIRIISKYEKVPRGRAPMILEVDIRR